MEGSKKGKILICIGVTVVIYLAFKYILPLIAPFVLALLIAAALSPQVEFLHDRLRVRRCPGTLLLMLFWGSIVGAGLWWLVGTLISQIQNVIANYDLYYSYVNEKMCSICEGVDGSLGLGRGSTLRYIDNMIVSLADTAQDKLMPSIMGSSIGAIRWCIMSFGVIVIFVMALYFLAKDYRKIMKMAEQSCIAGEYRYFKEHIGKILVTFIRTQFIIMLISMAVCGIGLLFLKNPYWLLLGVVLGLVDALPVFGTGTILIPWAVIEIISGKYVYGGVLIAICLISYLIREYLGPKLMGKELGVHPLYMLAAVYAGIMLFGVIGVFTGPIAFLLAKEGIVYYACNKPRE